MWSRSGKWFDTHSLTLPSAVGRNPNESERIALYRSLESHLPHRYITSRPFIPALFSFSLFRFRASVVCHIDLSNTFLARTHGDSDSDRTDLQ